MEKEIGKMCAEGFSFFGISNRLISHELKNILAIISETLGLLEELVELSEAGTQLKPGKLRSLSASVIEEVERANAIIRNMNTFAHSVDEFIREVDLSQAVSLMIELTQLDSTSKNTKLRLADGEACVIYTSPFFLQNLIYHAINHSLRGAGAENEIRVSFDLADNVARIVFSGIASNRIGEFPTKKEDFLAKALSAKLSLDVSAGEMHIVLPQRLSESPIQALFVQQ